MNNHFKIVIAGKRNAGKSTLMNLLTAQQVSIVSPVPGTTTDPVSRRMEIPGIGICTFVDTAGIDDTGILGEERVKKTFAELRSADLVLVVGESELPGISKFESSTIHITEFDEQSRDKILTEIASRLSGKRGRTILEGLVREGDRIILVCPIDDEAPQGRLILPQVMAIRDILDKKGIAEVMQPEELEGFLKSNSNVKLVVTDSQAFKEVSRIVPEDIPLTSFSILLARSNGPFETYLSGMDSLERLEDGDRILMLESCAHHATCNDIGRVKIPKLLASKTGKRLEFDFVSGLGELQIPVEQYALAIQCGGCMITPLEIRERLRPIIDAGIPAINYGMALAWANGIFERAVRLFMQESALK
ncbi:MAG: 50S ribosome-binding GTPase [Bacteroidales bacterium]|nr:50S ribosome-binding GTPase [Candidatus Cacconaster merdequi]